MGLKKYFKRDYKGVDFAHTPEKYLFPNQFMYVARSDDRKLVYTSPSFHAITGYNIDEVDLDKIADLVHPDDRALVSSAVRLAFNFGLSPLINKNNSTSCLLLNCRFKIKSGGYIQILRSTRVLESDHKNRMILFESIFTDLSDVKIDNSAFVKIIIDNEQCLFLTNDTNDIDFKCLSPREREIVDFMCDDLTSRQIADRLSVSKHTIDTHRRKILNKLGLKNTRELVLRMLVSSKK